MEYCKYIPDSVLKSIGNISLMEESCVLHDIRESYPPVSLHARYIILHFYEYLRNTIRFYGIGSIENIRSNRLRLLFPSLSLSISDRPSDFMVPTDSITSKWNWDIVRTGLTVVRMMLVLFST